MTAAVPAAEGMRRDGVGTGDCEWLLQLGAEAACILLPKKRGWTVGGGGGICRAATSSPRSYQRIIFRTGWVFCFCANVFSRSPNLRLVASSCSPALLML